MWGLHEFQYIKHPAEHLADNKLSNKVLDDGGDDTNEEDNKDDCIVTRNEDGKVSSADKILTKSSASSLSSTSPCISSPWIHAQTFDKIALRCQERRGVKTGFAHINQRTWSAGTSSHAVLSSPGPREAGITTPWQIRAMGKCVLLCNWVL